MCPNIHLWTHDQRTGDPVSQDQGKGCSSRGCRRWSDETHGSPRTLTLEETEQRRSANGSLGDGAMARHDGNRTVRAAPLNDDPTTSE